MEKLFVIVRADLEPGLQLAQVGHAVQAFNDQHPELARRWTNIAVLAARDAEHLGTLACDLGRVHRIATFHEPDIAGELTAIAVAGDARRRISSLPLALRQRTRRAA